MSDRTPPSNQGPSHRGPAEGTPEYDWLYGKRPPPTAGDDSTQAMGPGQPVQPVQPVQPPQPPQPPERPDSTRVMPTVPRSAAESPGSAQSRPAPLQPNQSPHQTPPPPPTPPTTQAGSGRRWFRPRRPRLRLRWLIWLLLLWLVFLVATPIWAWTKVSKVDAWPDGKRPADQGGTTYLIVGSDARPGLAGQRTDTIMLLHTGSGPNLLMSIPRDSIVDIPGHGDGNKINAAFAYGGPKLLVETIENDTGIRIDDYVEVGFTGFVGLVNAVGGIEVCPKENMKDPLAHLDIKKGCQEVDGKTALAYSRSRHVSALGDIDRAKHQREVVSAVGKKALSPWSVLNPVRWWQLNFGVADSVRISSGTGPIALAKFGWTMTHMTDALTCGVPISDLAVHWDANRSKEMFKHIIEDDTAGIGKQLCTPSGLPKSVTG
jgi:LCP family protein required for cell wall assembly